MNLHLIPRCIAVNHSFHRKLSAQINSQRILRHACLFSTLSNNITLNQSNLIKCNGSNGKRCYSDRLPTNKLPPLMFFPELVWPSLLKSIRNFILATFIIKPYFDREFSLAQFVAGSKKAVEVISARLSQGDLSALNGLITKDALECLQTSTSTMSLAQRQEIAVDKNDIYLSFPYQVGIMFDDSEQGNQKRFVEITMVYHMLKGLSSMRSRGEEPPLNLGMLPEYQDKILICNYRFVREFTKGVDDDWTVNLLNHFKPKDNFESN